MKRFSVILWAMLIMALVFSACTPAQPSEKTKVRVATDATFPPFEW